MNKTGRLKKNGLWESNWIVHTTWDSGTKTGRFRTRANEYFQTSDPTEPGPKQFWKSRTNSGLWAWPGQICWNPPFVHDLTSLKSKILELKFYLKKNFHKLISVDQMVRILKRILISYPLYFSCLIFQTNLHFINGLSICLGHMTSFVIGFLMLDVSSISENRKLS